MRKLRIFFLLITLPLATFSWWEEGHRTVSEIAYRHLNTKTKRQVNHLIKTFKAHDGPDHALYYMAIWPDILSMSGIRIFNPWHYIDQPYYADDVTQEAKTDPNNVVKVINESSNILTKHKASDYEKARFLSFLIHTVGDIHQPLHAISRYSFDKPEGDRGGNEFHLHYETKHGTEIKNLHALWDSVLGTMDNRDRRHIPDDADQIEKEFPMDVLREKAQDLEPMHWAKESYEIAKSSAYQLQEHTTPSHLYIKTQTKIARKQLALAGYRLANLLNAIYKK